MVGRSEFPDQPIPASSSMLEMANKNDNPDGQTPQENGQERYHGAARQVDWKAPVGFDGETMHCCDKSDQKARQPGAMCQQIPIGFRAPFW